MNIQGISVSFSAALALLAFQGGAIAATVSVPGTTSIWLAGQINGTSVSGYFGSDVAPDNSPVSIDVPAAATLTFSVSGSTSVDANCFEGPDGGCYADQSSFSPPPADALYNGPASALIGIFTTDSPLALASWVAGPDYQDPANSTTGSFAPALNQVFFIGDGLTGTGGGAMQSFSAPVGATHLYIGVADSLGSSTGNLGSLTVDFTGGTVSAVPEPTAWALMALGTGLIGLTARARRKQRLGCP